MKFLLIRIFLSVAMLSGFTAITQAGDVVDWSDYSLYSEYDKSDEELTMKFVAYSEGNPKEDFELEMEVGDEDCEMELEYKSFQVKGECVLDIDEDDIRGLYETSLIVTSEDNNDEVYKDSSVTIKVAGYEEDFDWDDLKVDAIFDEERERLELKIYLEDVSREPDYNYEIEFKIDNKTFKKDFDWDEDEDELSIELTTPVDKDDIEDDYDIDFEVVNTDDDDDKVGGGDLEFDVDIIKEEDEFDWDDLEYTALYDEDRERLTIVLFLEKIKTEPKGTYEAFMEFEREDYTKRFKYDEDDDIFSATFSIKIEEDDLDNYYDIDVQIEDDDEDEVYDDEIDIDIEYLSEADDFDWDDLKVSASYNDNKERLYIELVLEDITSKPTFTYSVELEFADEEEDFNFVYDSDKDELRASTDMRIDEDDIEDEYEFDIEVENNDQDRVYNEDIDVKILDYKDIVADEESDYKWKNTTVDFNYSTSSQYLVIQVELENVNEYPSLDYFTDITLSGINEKIGSKLRYDSQNKKFYGTYNLYIKEKDIEDDYKITMFITNEYDDLQHLFSEEKDVIFDADKNKETTQRVSASTKKAVDNFADKIYKRYNKKSDAIAYFKVVITVLDGYANQKTRYRSVIDEINFLLQEMIDNA